MHGRKVVVNNWQRSPRKQIGRLLSEAKKTPFLTPKKPETKQFLIKKNTSSWQSLLTTISLLRTWFQFLTKAETEKTFMVLEMTPVLPWSHSSRNFFYFRLIPYTSPLGVQSGPLGGGGETAGRRQGDLGRNPSFVIFWFTWFLKDTGLLLIGAKKMLCFVWMCLCGMPKPKRSLTWDLWIRGKCWIWFELIITIIIVIIDIIIGCYHPVNLSEEIITPWVVNRIND